MANIPVEERSGSHWWAWLLGLLLVAGVVWLVVDGIDSEEPAMPDVATVEPIAPVEPGLEDNRVEEFGATNAISDVSQILGASDPASFADRAVDFENLRVTKVVSDKGFFVTPMNGSQEEIFIALSEESAEGGPVEGRVNVQEGQIINLRGKLISVDQAEFERLELAEADIAEVEDERLYVSAERINITQEGTT